MDDIRKIFMATLTLLDCDSLQAHRGFCTIVLHFKGSFMHFTIATCMYM